MADNTQITPGIGASVATDDIDGVQYQRIKLVSGADGVNDGDISAANPYPVVQTGALPAGTNNVGDVDIASALPAGTNNIGDVDIASIADGLDVTQGALADAAITSSAAGSVSGKLRGLVAILADVWDNANNLVRTHVTNILGITASGQGTKATSLPVTLASDEDAVGLAAGELHVGQVGGEGATIVVTPTVTAGAYTAGDCVGGVLTFANAARVAGGGGIVKSLLLIDDAGQNSEMELWLFSAAFTSPGDNAPWVATEVELHTLVGIVSTGTGIWYATGTPGVARVEASQRYDLAATSLFGQLITRDTPTFAATDDITIIIGLVQD